MEKIMEEPVNDSLVDELLNFLMLLIERGYRCFYRSWEVSDIILDRVKELILGDIERNQRVVVQINIDLNVFMLLNDRSPYYYIDNELICYGEFRIDLLLNGLNKYAIREIAKNTNRYMDLNKKMEKILLATVE
jgi:hypothetical protein